VSKLFLEAIRLGLWGLLLGPTVAVELVLGAMIFDPKCGVADSGGCAMGLITVPFAAALPSAHLGFALGLARGLWRQRPSDLPGTIRRLRDWGRED
jgi:hypothetical protein